MVMERVFAMRQTPERGRWGGEGTGEERRGGEARTAINGEKGVCVWRKIDGERRQFVVDAPSGSLSRAQPGAAQGLARPLVFLHTQTPFSPSIAVPASSPSSPLRSSPLRSRRFQAFGSSQIPSPSQSLASARDGGVMSRRATRNFCKCSHVSSSSREQYVERVILSHNSCL
jgi:hypothetical protein